MSNISFKKLKRREYTFTGKIVGASDVWCITDSRGRKTDKAVLHIQAEAAASPDEEPEAKAINVKGDLCNFVGCIGRRVKIKYYSRVFSFVKNGIHSFGNEIFAKTIHFI